MGVLYDLVTNKTRSLAEAARRSLGNIASKAVEAMPPVAAVKAAPAAIKQWLTGTAQQPTTVGEALKQTGKALMEVINLPSYAIGGVLEEARKQESPLKSAWKTTFPLSMAKAALQGIAQKKPVMEELPKTLGVRPESLAGLLIGFAGEIATPGGHELLALAKKAKPLARVPEVGEEVIARFAKTDLGEQLAKRFGREVSATITSEPFKVRSGAVLVKANVAGQEVTLPISKHLEWFKPVAEKAKETIGKIPLEELKPAVKGAEEMAEKVAAKAPVKLLRAAGEAMGKADEVAEGAAKAIGQAGEEVAEAAARLAPPPKVPKKLPTEEKLTVKASEEINEAAQKLLQRSPADPIAVEDHPRLFKRIGQALREGRISVEAIPELRAYELTQEEAATLFEQAASYSGRTLERLSRTAKRIQKLFPEEIPVQEVPKTAWDRIASLPKGIINYWRASLVSQLATAVRNVGSQGMRYLLHIVDDAAAGALEAVTGKAAPRQAFAPMLEDIFALFRRLDKRRIKKLAEVLDYDPIIKGKLYNTPVGDISLGEKAANLLNTFNRTQEYFFRNLTFDAVLSGELKRLGLNLATVSPEDIPVKALVKAVDRALELTYAAAPKARLGRDLVRVVNQYPFLAVLGYPFPRYLNNAVRAIYEFSPLGITRFLSPKYVKTLASGNPREAYHVISRAAIGSILFTAAAYLRNSRYAGEKWYEVKIGDKRIDVRPFGPLLPTYLFIAEAMKDPSKMENRDWLEGMLGINRMAGTTLFLTSMLAGQGPDNLKKAIAQFAGEFLGGFSVPFRTLKDFVAFFSEEEKVYRYTKEQPVTGPFLANIPGLQRMLPPAPLITRAEPSQAEYPATRQLTGLTIRTKTPLEAELDRLGIDTYDLLPKTGDPYIDRLITAETGKVIARISGIVTNPKYRKLSDPDKAELLKSIFRDVKKETKERVLREHAAEIASRMRREMQGMTAEEKRAYLEGQRRKGLLQEPILDALRHPFDAETLRRALERSVQP